MPIETLCKELEQSYYSLFFAIVRTTWHRNRNISLQSNKDNNFGEIMALKSSRAFAINN